MQDTHKCPGSHYEAVAYCPHCDLELCTNEDCPEYGTHDVPNCPNINDPLDI